MVVRSVANYFVGTVDAAREFQQVRHACVCRLPQQQNKMTWDINKCIAAEKKDGTD